MLLYPPKQFPYCSVHWRINHLFYSSILESIFYKSSLWKLQFNSMGPLASDITLLPQPSMSFDTMRLLFVQLET